MSTIAAALQLCLVAMLWGCASDQVKSDPIATLNAPSLTGYQHNKAMEALDATAPNDPETLKALHNVVSRDYYSLGVREAALNRLAERDLDNLKRTIRNTMPRSESPGWIERCSQIIAERGWTDLSPALVSSWARPRAWVRDEMQRPEYMALASMHGPDNITDVVYTLFLESKSAGQQGLRTRCWDLLHRLGQRERLVQLLASSNVPQDDAMLLDLRAGAAELGLVPRNREEILWLRKLREPDRSDFWARAVSAVKDLSPQRRADLELRDLPILVSASLHDPEMLRMSSDDLYARAESYLQSQPHYVQDSNYAGIADSSQQRLRDHRGKLTWGDLAAIHIAIRALQVPEVVAHLFNYAERDQVDTSTEYGGVIALDAKDRFEIREFQAMMRRHDQEFIASQAMLDAAYTSIFHFHLHAQKYRNEQFAGPGFGDINYADNVYANCLVFTFMNKDTMNVDFYRHGRVVIDLGVIKRPNVQASAQGEEDALRQTAASRMIWIPLLLHSRISSSQVA